MKARADAALDRMAESRWTLPVLAVLVVVALSASTFTLVQWAQAQSQRDADIVARAEEQAAASVAGCERGNDVRADQRALGYGTLHMIGAIVDAILARVEGATAVELAAEIAPTFDEFRRVVDSIPTIDCQAVTPGATTTTLPAEDP